MNLFNEISYEMNLFNLAKRNQIAQYMYIFV